MDITDFVLDAMRTIALARDIAAREGGTVTAALEDLLAQADLLAGDVAPLTEALIRKFAPNGRAARADTIAEFLKRYAAEAQKIGGSDSGLFDAPGPLDALKAIDRESFGRLKELGRAAVPPAPEPDAQLEAMPAGIFDEGAASPSIEAADNLILEDLREILRTRRVTDEEHDAVEEMIEARVRLCAGMDRTAPVTAAQLRAMSLGEHLHNVLQALCRATVRGLQDEGGCAPCRAYIIAPKQSGLWEELPRLFPSCQLEKWQPQGITKLTKRVQRALAAIDLWDGYEIAYVDLALAIAVDKKDFTKHVARDPRFKEEVAKRGYVEADISRETARGARTAKGIVREVVFPLDTDSSYSAVDPD